MNKAIISSIIRMKSAHDESSSFWPASAGSIIASQLAVGGCWKGCRLKYRQDRFLHLPVGLYNMSVESVVDTVPGVIEGWQLTENRECGVGQSRSHSGSL